jgi:hypothetical protein
MIEIVKTLTGERFERLWATTCPDCYEYIEYIYLSPLRCPKCKLALMEYSELLKDQEKRVKHYREEHF